MPATPKSKHPPRHKFVRTPAVRLATALKILARETVEHRAALDEAAALKIRYERAKL